MASTKQRCPESAANASGAAHRTPSKEYAMDLPQPTQPTPARQQLALIASIVNHSAGHEERALREVVAVLAGATLGDLLAARLTGGA